MLHLQLAAIALAATTLAASGCGGSSKTGSTGASTSATLASTTTATATPTTKATSGKPMTHAELIVIAKAGAICKRVRARGVSLKLSTRQVIAREIPLFASYQGAALAELRKLVPPASLAHEWQQFAAVARTLAGDTTRLGEHVKAYHFATVGPIVTRINNDKINMTTLAKRDAITGCERLY